jgi:4-amino-4-deoxy-L-arabinose transferase-like glycosyltransferase
MPDAMIGASGPLSRCLDWISTSHLRALAVLLFMGLVTFLPGQVTLQPMDRDEPRFAQASKQMLETRDFIDIRFQDEARHKKPVGIYWLQSLTVSAGEALGMPQARMQIWLYRLPSLIGALGTVLLTYWALLAVLAPRWAFLAAAMMAASILLGVEARLAKTDAVLAACAVAAMGAMLRVYLDWRRALAFVVWRHNWLVFWLANAVAVLIKGPILPMVWGLCAIILSIRERGIGWLKPLRFGRGLIIMALAVLPWFAAIMYKTGGSFLAESAGKDMLGKVAEGQEKHGAPPGFYFLAFFGTFWPLAPLVAMSSFYAWRERTSPAILFFLAWVLPSWLVFEAVPTKLPHYVLPLYPALAGIALLAIANNGINLRRFGAIATRWLIALIPALLLGGLAAAAWIMEQTVPVLPLGLLILGLAITVIAVLSFGRAHFEEGLLRSALASLVVTGAIFGPGQEALRALKVSPRLAQSLQEVSCPKLSVMTAGYREPSLVFLTSTNLLMGSGAEAAQFLHNGMVQVGAVRAMLVQPDVCRVAFVANREKAAFDAEILKLGLKPRLVTTVSGFNINSGRKLDIAVLTTAP